MRSGLRHLVSRIRLGKSALEEVEQALVFCKTIRESKHSTTRDKMAAADLATRILKHTDEAAKDAEAIEKDMFPPTPATPTTPADSEPRPVEYDLVIKARTKPVQGKG